MYRSFFLSISICVLISCSVEPVRTVKKPRTEEKTSATVSEEATLKKEQQTKDSLYRSQDFVDVQSLNANIFIDLKYAGPDNFMKQRLYFKLNKAYLQKDVAERLARCQHYLTEIDTGLHLLIYDALRPVSVQQRMWTALDSIPAARRKNMVSSPLSKSLHNFGAAVDLTICRSDGQPLDMGAGYDDFREIAYPSKEMYFFAKGELTQLQMDNRRLLRQVMRKEGFRNIPKEWWHFDACTRAQASRKYTFLEEEF